MKTLSSPHQNLSLRAALDGIAGILVTPYQDGEIAPSRLRPIVDRAVVAGIHSLVINGNTSEFYALTAAETERMVHSAAEVIDSRVPLVAGVGRNIGEARQLARASVRAGASALMLHQPPDPFVSPRGVVDYVSAIADAADGTPLVLYIRNENIGLPTIEALCDLPGVAGFKWASPTPLVLAEAIRRTRGRDIAWVGGLAETWAPAFYAVGARGFTSGLINVYPKHSFAIYQALEQANYPEAIRLIALMQDFEELRAQENNGTNVSVVKAALKLQGNDCGATRPPSAWPLTVEAQQCLEALLSGGDLLS
jgi:4-hydroxy-tetrahydrodipicolinate synthase